MKSLSKRKTSAEYVEKIRKNYFGRWLCFARVVLVVNGLVLCGMFIWMLTCLPRLAPSFLGIDADTNPLFYTFFFIAWAVGLSAGVMCFSGVWSLFQGIFWPGPQRAIRLMLKYHDALVANGISPDEVE